MATALTKECLVGVPFVGELTNAIKENRVVNVTKLYDMTISPMAMFINSFAYIFLYVPSISNL